MRRLKRFGTALSLAVVLAVGTSKAIKVYDDVIVPVCYTEICLACSEVLDWRVCAAMGL